MAAGTRIRFCPSVEPFLSVAGDLYLLPTPGEPQKRIPAPFGEFVYRTVLAIEAGTAADVVSAIPDAGADEQILVQEIIDGLVEFALVRSYREAAASDQFDRQSRYFTQTGRSGTGAQHKLTTTRALVVGLGGLGCAVAEALARVGVGAIHGVDFDTVQLENLPRQTLYTPADVGHTKTDVAELALRRIAPASEVSTTTTQVCSVEQLVELATEHRSTVIFASADAPRFSIKGWLDTAAFQLGIPVLMGGHRPPMLYVGPMIVPGETMCFGCFAAKDHELVKEMDRHLDATSFVVPGLGYADQLVGNFLVSEYVGWATGTHQPSIMGREYGFNLHDFSPMWIEPARGGCDRCNVEGRAAA